MLETSETYFLKRYEPENQARGDLSGIGACSMSKRLTKTA